MDRCPSCGSPLTSRTLGRSTPADRAIGSAGVEVRRCASCRRLAQRGSTSDGWTDTGLDPSIDHLFDWQPQPMPPHWAWVPIDERAALETELQTEVAVGHPLVGEHVIAIARCEGCDEAIFSVETDPVRFVSVHLTWSGAPERPPWPRTENVHPPLSRNLAKHEH